MHGHFQRFHKRHDCNLIACQTNDGTCFVVYLYSSRCWARDHSRNQSQKSLISSKCKRATFIFCKPQTSCIWHGEKNWPTWPSHCHCGELSSKNAQDVLSQMPIRPWLTNLCWFMCKVHAFLCKEAPRQADCTQRTRFEDGLRTPTIKASPNNVF